MLTGAVPTLASTWRVSGFSRFSFRRTCFLQERLSPPLPLLIIPLETAMTFFFYPRSLVAQPGANKSPKSPRQPGLLEHTHGVHRFSRKGNLPVNPSGDNRGKPAPNSTSLCGQWGHKTCLSSTEWVRKCHFQRVSN